MGSSWAGFPDGSERGCMAGSTGEGPWDGGGGARCASLGFRPSTQEKDLV